MTTRHTKIIPGFDDIINGCEHEPKGEHGRNGEEWLYIVRADDGLSAIYLEVGTSLFPSTTPHREAPPAGLRASRLQLHLAVPYINDEGDVCLPRLQRGGCVVLDQEMCACPEDSALAAGYFFDEHYVKGETPEQPESFWLALEAKFDEMMVKVDLFDEEADEERMLGWLRDPARTPASQHDVVRWIQQAVRAAAQLEQRLEADRKETIAISAQITELTKTVELAKVMIASPGWASTPPVRCWCGEKITHINWCLAHAPRCNSGAHFHGNCACESPSAAFWEQWDRTNEARQK